MATKTKIEDTSISDNQPVDIAKTERAFNFAVNRAQIQRKELLKHFKSEPKETVYLSPMYRPYVGKIMPISINGITIYFPVDGKPYPVPRSFADAITSRRMAIDEIITKTNAMADIQNNFDGDTPGQLKLI